MTISSQYCSLSHCIGKGNFPYLAAGKENSLPWKLKLEQFHVLRTFLHCPKAPMAKTFFGNLSSSSRFDRFLYSIILLLAGVKVEEKSRIGRSRVGIISVICKLQVPRPLMRMGKELPGQEQKKAK